MKILIDADGCPVVRITEETARRYKIPCVIVCDSAHIFKSEYSEVVTADVGCDSADMLLVNRAEKNDIVVTQDYGLAALCLSKGALALNQNGMIYSNENIDSLLFSRHVCKKARRAGKRIKGPSKRTPEQDKAFCDSLSKLINLNHTPMKA